MYVIGLDYGTLSARALAVDVRTGAVMADASCDYAHGVMDAALPDGTPLPPGWALQHPRDYLDALVRIVPESIKKAGIRPDEVIGIGIDFTSSTLLPVAEDGTPLCFMEALASDPYAYAMLWKHHGAAEEAELITGAAAAEPWLKRYGGRVSAEWALPKLWSLVRHAPRTAGAAAMVQEASDWLARTLTGEVFLNSCAAGYKYFLGEGGPGPAFWRKLDPALADFFSGKVTRRILPIGSRCGSLLPEAAARLGLPAGIAVAVPVIDAHAAAPAAGLSREGQMLDIVGTSGCQMLLASEFRDVPGVFGAVRDGVLPGFIGYETGQSAVGDAFAWAAERFTSAETAAAAKAAGISVHAYLTERAARLKPGESGLIALDWFNGNRSILNDAELSGMILGLTLRTRDWEVYRTLIEASAFGLRAIADNYARAGIPVRELFMTGGISQKNPLVMQICADVLRKPLWIVPGSSGSALGSAIYAAAAAGARAGGYDTPAEAQRAMAPRPERQVLPEEKNAAVYDRLYQEYMSLHDCFGRGGNQVMRRLKALQREAAQTSR